MLSAGADLWVALKGLDLAVDSNIRLTIQEVSESNKENKCGMFHNIQDKATWEFRQPLRFLVKS